jgi:hypothetical protein
MKLVVNGAEVEVDDRHAKTPLLWVLRDVLGLQGTKFASAAPPTSRPKLYATATVQRGSGCARAETLAFRAEAKTPMRSPRQPRGKVHVHD